MKHPPILKLERFSLGIGDRFAHQAGAQLEACRMASARRVTVVPVWNKSHREHNLAGSQPASVRAAAEAAVERLHWPFPYHVDADHISLETVDPFIPCSDFFTIDVAAEIGRVSDRIALFVDRHPELIGELHITGIKQPLRSTRDLLLGIACRYLAAVEEAARVYRHIEQRRGGSPFVTELSMDETDNPQTPLELLVILAAVADEGIPIQTIAPKFTGRFNKGVDYVGDVSVFEREFSDDVAILAHAALHYGLPATLKLSVHSGSDKFSLYGTMRRTLQMSGAGLHLKTAGTTWLEELIGLAEAGGEGLVMAKEIYCRAHACRPELCAPYASVIEIREDNLPQPADVQYWTSSQFTAALRHDRANPEFNPDLRQLLHVGYKVAAGMGPRYLQMLDEFEAPISRNVTLNLFERHISPLFLG